MSQKYEKLKTLLKELFQLDQPDLDFGLYRVMHAKSAEVSQYPSVPMTALSPALSTVRSTMEMAAIPDETASASSAPSSRATARSSERTFGKPFLAYSGCPAANARSACDESSNA